MKHNDILVYVCRHGTTKLNASGCFRGSIDVALDSQGVKDAHALSFYLKPIEVCGIVASDRLRSARTAQIIARQKDMEAVLTPSLHAWDVGVFSGKPKSPENVELLENYIHQPDIPIPDGESLSHFKSRVRPVIGRQLILL